LTHPTLPAIISSPLDDLRGALKSAKEGSEETFIPKRTISLDSGRPNIVAFASNDTRLFVGFDQGQLAVYDTTAVFSPGSGNLAPLHINPEQSGPVKQISSNPGIEPSFSDIVAVVRSNGSVVLFSANLEIQGGWAAEDPASMPVAGMYMSSSHLFAN
jgi:nucleoporin NUP159